jgi:non-specific serine/threonine protein kinase
LEALTHLLDKSLAIKQERAGGARYRLLEPIRQYAREKLIAAGEDEAVRARHLDYFTRLAEEAESKFETSEQMLWLNRCEAELDNVRAALYGSVSAVQVEMGLRLVAALEHFWYIRDHQSEGIEMLQNLLARPEAAKRTLARAKALNVLGLLHYRPGNYAQAKGAAAEALAIGEELRDARTKALALFSLGRTNAYQGNAAEGRSQLEQALAAFRALDEPYFVGRVLGGLGLSALRTGAYADAISWFVEDVTLMQGLGDRIMAGFAIRHLGFALLHQHDVAGALSKFQEGLESLRLTGGQQGVAAGLAGCAAVALVREQFARAAQLLGAVEALLESGHNKLLPYDYDQYTHNVATLRAHMDAASFSAAWEAGRRLTLAQAIAEAEQMVIPPETPPAPPPTAPRDPNALTPRELEVLRLLAQRMSDAEIAEKLVISRRTVSTHLTAIYDKLGVNSRRAAMRHALDHKLI